VNAYATLSLFIVPFEYGISLEKIRFASIYLLTLAIVFMVLGIYSEWHNLQYSALVERISEEPFNYKAFLHLIFFFFGFLALCSIYFAEKSESKALSKTNTTLHKEIAERKRAEEGLRQSETKYRALVETTDTGYAILNENGKVIDANAEYIRLSGHKKIEELLGRSIIEWTADDPMKKNAQAVKKALSQGFLRNFEVEFVHKDGKSIPVDLNATTVIAEEGIRILALCRDISERKQPEKEKMRLEEQLQQAHKLESIGVLADGMAHDFNNILTGILGHIDIAKDDVQPGSETYSILADAEDRCMKAKDLTQRFQTFSDHIVPRKEIDSLVDLVKDSTTLALSGSNVKSRFFIPDDLWLVEFNKEQMRQVIHNLILNAREALSDVGTIKVSAENVTVDSEKIETGLPVKKGKYVKISIEDKGSGISEENLPKVFDPYFSTKERGIQKGMGLGLSIAYSIIKKHDGYIYLNSKVSVGSTVNVYLPVHE